MREMIDVLRTRYRFEEWRGRQRSGESLFVFRFFLAGNELPGWRAHRIRTAPTPEGPAGTLSVWQREGGDKDDLIGLDVYEAESRAAAHEFLVRLLGEFEGDLGQGRGDVGDVSFLGSTGGMALFARANLVVLVRTLGTQSSVTGVAEGFDRELVARPKADGVSAPRIDAFRSRGVAGREVALEARAADPLGRPVQYRLFAPSGDFSVSAGELRFAPRDEKPVRITLFAINADRRAASAELEIGATRA